MNCYILVPGLSEKYRSGGLLVTRDLARLLNAKLIATHEKHPGALAIDVIANAAKQSFFIVTWGPLVSKHIKLIRRHAPSARILYYAQSFGWNIKVPPRIPIICVSRYVMSQWALRAQENYLAYIPPPLNPVFKCENKTRDIDILVHTRKQNEYCLKKLLPALKAKSYKLQAITDWIPQNEFAALLNRTKIFLYLTGTHKAGFFRKLPAEGFGLPALEALACGAMVGSNLLGGVTDFLTPGENCIKLQNKVVPTSRRDINCLASLRLGLGDLDFDLKQIQNALSDFKINAKAAEEVRRAYDSEVIRRKWKEILAILQKI